MIKKFDDLTVVEFGNGTVTVELGKYGDQYAVFINNADPPGTPGQLVLDTKNTRGFAPDEIVLVFPTKKRAAEVVNSLFNGELVKVGQQPTEPTAWFPTYRNGEIVRSYGDGSPVPACRTKEEADQVKRAHLGASGPVVALYTTPQSTLSKFLEKEEWNDAFAQGFNAGFNSDEKPALDVTQLVEALEVMTRVFSPRTGEPGPDMHAETEAHQLATAVLADYHKGD